MGKVVHAYPETHAAVKAYCAKIQMGVKDWVDYILQDALKDPPPITVVRRHRGGAFAKAPPEPVEKKTDIPRFEGSKGDDESKPWERPAFWEDQEKDQDAEAGRRDSVAEGPDLSHDARVRAFENGGVGS